MRIMAEPLIPISTIVRDARQAADAGLPITDCPYPDYWEAADRWRKAYYAREQELLAEVTT